MAVENILEHFKSELEDWKERIDFTYEALAIWKKKVEEGRLSPTKYEQLQRDMGEELSWYTREFSIREALIKFLEGSSTNAIN